MNCTTENQGTRCFLIIGLKTLSIGADNRSIVQLSFDPCAELTKLANSVVQRYGLSAV